MITLYQFASSPFSEKVRRALGYKALAYDIHEVERSAMPAGRYAAISPTGKFPVIDHDGRTIADSTASSRTNRCCPHRRGRPLWRM